MDEIRNTLCHIRYLSREIYGFSDYLKRMKKDYFQETDSERINSVAGTLEYMLDELKMYDRELTKRERETWTK